MLEAWNASPGRDFILNTSKPLYLDDKKAKGQTGKHSQTSTCPNTPGSERMRAQKWLPIPAQMVLPFILTSALHTLLRVSMFQKLVLFVLYFMIYSLFTCLNFIRFASLLWVFPAEICKMTQAIRRRTLDRRQELMVMISLYCGFKISGSFAI